MLHLGQVAHQRKSTLPDVRGRVLHGRGRQVSTRAAKLPFGDFRGLQAGTQQLAGSDVQGPEKRPDGVRLPSTWQHCSRASRRAVDAGAEADSSASNRNPSASATPDSASRLHTM